MIPYSLVLFADFCSRQDSKNQCFMVCFSFLGETVARCFKVKGCNCKVHTQMLSNRDAFRQEGSEMLYNHEGAIAIRTLLVLQSDHVLSLIHI
eukprot:1324674-Amphidinium_carterae.1